MSVSNGPKIDRSDLSELQHVIDGIAKHILPEKSIEEISNILCDAIDEFLPFMITVSEKSSEARKAYENELLKWLMGDRSTSRPQKPLESAKELVFSLRECDDEKVINYKGMEIMFRKRMIANYPSFVGLN